MSRDPVSFTFLAEDTWQIFCERIRVIMQNYPVVTRYQGKFEWELSGLRLKQSRRTAFEQCKLLEASNFQQEFEDSWRGMHQGGHSILDHTWTVFLVVTEKATAPRGSHRPSLARIREIGQDIHLAHREQQLPVPGPVTTHVMAQAAARNPSAPLPPLPTAAIRQAQRLDEMRRGVVDAGGINVNGATITCTVTIPIAQLARALGLPEAHVLRRMFDEQLPPIIDNEPSQNVEDVDHQ